MKTNNETLLNQKINLPINKNKKEKKDRELLLSVQNNRVNIYK